MNQAHPTRKERGDLGKNQEPEEQGKEPREADRKSKTPGRDEKPSTRDRDAAPARNGDPLTNAVPGLGDGPWSEPAACSDDGLHGHDGHDDQQHAKPRVGQDREYHDEAQDLENGMKREVAVHEILEG